MANKGSNNQDSAPSGVQLDAKQEWASQNVWPLAVLFIISILLCFLPWFLTVLFLPADDMQQGRDEVELQNGRKITVQYPLRFLADDSVRPIYLTAGSIDPVTITIELTPNLPLILTGTASDATSRVRHSRDGNLVITWPLATSGSPSAVPNAAGSLTPTVTPSSTPTHSSTVVPFPIVSLPNTVILYFKNAGTESDWDPRRWLVQKSLRIDEATTVNKVPSNEIKFDIETTNRASWRAFAEKYSFVAILPFLVAAVTFWFTGYANRRRVQNRQAARERLEAYKTALKNAENEKVVSAAWIELRRLRSYLPDDDLGRAELLHRVSTGDFPAGLELEFNTWSDAWVGTLILAGEALTQQSSQHKTHPAHTARNNEASAGIESTQSSKLADLYRCIRIFPVDLASPEAERRLRKLREELGLPAPQSHDWPPLAEPPDDYPLDTEGTPATIGTLKLFPRETGNAFDEIGYLFSEKEWYWREHPLYVKLRTCLQPVLVYGDVGSGRTALALALTQHAEHEDKVLGSYHKGAVSLAEAQVSLGQELLRFIGKRSTRLSNLTRDDRDLLASVLLSVLSDDIQVLSALSSVDPAQFIVISEDDKAKLPLLQEQAKVEFRLLSDSVKRMKGKPPLLGQQWFYALSRCAAKLRFVRVRIALDLTAEDFHRWRGEHLGQFRAGLPADLNFPFQLIVLVPGSITDFDGARHGFVPEQLQWVARSDNGITYLMKMLHYRYERRVGGNESPIQPGAQNALCSAAQHNPRRLARLWNRIASKYPERTQITSRMITHANAELERP